MVDRQSLTARSLLSRCVGVLEFYQEESKSEVTQKLANEIIDFLWPEENDRAGKIGIRNQQRDTRQSR